MKYAIALEGGGAKGAYHAGALKAIQELELDIEAVTGTSIGSINAAYYIQEGADALLEFWENMRPEQLIPDIYPTVQETLKQGNVTDYKGLLREIRHTISERGINLENFKKTLYEYIDEKKVRKIPIDFGLVTYSLTDFKPIQIMIKDIPEGKLIEYLIASSYLPGFKREKLVGKSFLDGAFYDNLPVNLLAEHGYKNVIAIELLGMGLKKKVKDDAVNIISIKPSGDTGRTLEFTHHKTNIKMGYYDTMRIFKSLYGKWFYLEDIWSPKKAYKFIDQLSEVQVEGLAEVLSIKKIPFKRCLYEKIIPKLMELLHIPEEADYNMILIYILEYLGKLLEVDRYQITTMTKLIELIRVELHKHSEEIIDWNQSIVKIMNTTKIYSHTFKDKVIVGCAQMIITGENRGGIHGL